MIHVISLVFPGKPISKDNRRYPAIRRGAPVIKIPETYRDFEKRIKIEAKKQLFGRKDRDRFPILHDTKLVAYLMFFYPYEPTGNDIFNSPKSVCDALQRIIYADDNQFIIGGVGKARDRNNPRIEVIIMEPDQDAKSWWADLKKRCESQAS
jgi:Holliday junction resolvase RusA-like endonuclease